jgi:hypothetical protein
MGILFSPQADDGLLSEACEALGHSLREAFSVSDCGTFTGLLNPINEANGRTSTKGTETLTVEG